MKTWITFLALCVVAIEVATADSDQDRARRAVEQGLILPLRDILAKAQQTHPGQVVKAELDDEDGSLVYELKVLTGDGRVMELIYDARTGNLLKSKGKVRKE